MKWIFFPPFDFSQRRFTRPQLQSARWPRCPSWTSTAGRTRCWCRWLPSSSVGRQSHSLKVTRWFSWDESFVESLSDWCARRPRSREIIKTQAASSFAYSLFCFLQILLAEISQANIRGKFYESLTMTVARSSVGQRLRRRWMLKKSRCRVCWSLGKFWCWEDWVSLLKRELSFLKKNLNMHNKFAIRQKT